MHARDIQYRRVYAAPDRPLKVVAVEPLVGRRKSQAFFST